MEIVRIGGFDPGLRFTGYGIVNFNTETNEIWVSNCGIAKTPQKFKGLEAILIMNDKLEEITKRECFEACDNVIVEMPAAVYFNKFSSGALLPVAAVAGSLFSMIDHKQLIPVYPSVWNRGKKKEATTAMTESILGDYSDWLYDDIPKAKPQFEHIIDAVSMALWYIKLNYAD